MHNVSGNIFYHSYADEFHSRLRNIWKIDIARDFKLLNVSDTISEKHNDFQYVTVCVLRWKWTVMYKKIKLYNKNSYYYSGVGCFFPPIQWCFWERNVRCWFKGSSLFTALRHGACQPLKLRFLRDVLRILLSTVLDPHAWHLIQEVLFHGNNQVACCSLRYHSSASVFLGLAGVLIWSWCMTCQSQRILQWKWKNTE